MTSRSELDKVKLHYEYHEDYPEIRKAIRRHKAKKAAERKGRSSRNGLFQDDTQEARHRKFRKRR